MITIRQYNDSDKESIITMILEILNIEYGIKFCIEELPDLNEINKFYVLKDNGNFWVATVENKVVSCMGIMSLNGYDYELRRMYTKNEYRGIGLSQMIMNTFNDWCKINKIQSVYLEANENWKAANHIYEKYDFKIISAVKLPKEFNVVKAATHFYHRKSAQQVDAPEPATMA